MIDGLRQHTARRAITLPASSAGKALQTHHGSSFVFDDANPAHEDHVSAGKSQIALKNICGYHWLSIVGFIHARCESRACVYRSPCRAACWSNELTSVVFPEPRKPTTTKQGTRPGPRVAQASTRSFSSSDNSCPFRLRNSALSCDKSQKMHIKVMAEREFYFTCVVAVRWLMLHPPSRCLTGHSGKFR